MGIEVAIINLISQIPMSIWLSNDGSIVAASTILCGTESVRTVTDPNEHRAQSPLLNGSLEPGWNPLLRSNSSFVALQLTHHASLRLGCRLAAGFGIVPGDAPRARRIPRANFILLVEGNAQQARLSPNSWPP